LYFDTTKDDPPNTFQILAQTLVSVGMLIGAAELFVNSIEHLAHGLGADPLVLTLVIAPLATELPEKINSVLWIRQGKDTLALGNITGAMVFQTMPLVAFGMVFTGWRLTGRAGPASRRAGRRSGRAGAGTRLTIMPYDRTSPQVTGAGPILTPDRHGGTGAG
jgi:Ca2+/Na+ antiporter